MKKYFTLTMLFLASLTSCEDMWNHCVDGMDNGHPKPGISLHSKDTGQR